jgi:hypothetical protein
MEEHHHRFLASSLVAVLVGGVMAAGGYWAYWNFYARFRPVTIAKNQAEIQRLLDEADWVSPGRTGPAIYVVAYRDCDACTAYEREEFPKLAAGNVDTRVILFARPDRQGLPQSTEAERASIAELWINRDWNLFARWMATPHAAWTAEGIKPADHDLARRAVVGASRDFVAKLFPMVKTAGLGDAYPLLIWRDRDGFLKACSCTDERSFHFVRADLGAPSKGLDWPQSAPSPASAPASSPASAPQGAPASAPQSAPASGPASTAASASSGAQASVTAPALPAASSATPTGPAQGVSASISSHAAATVEPKPLFY